MLLSSSIFSTCFKFNVMHEPMLVVGIWLCNDWSAFIMGLRLGRKVFLGGVLPLCLLVMRFSLQKKGKRKTEKELRE